MIDDSLRVVRAQIDVAVAAGADEERCCAPSPPTLGHVA
jgi:hypothetical protein